MRFSRIAISGLLFWVVGHSSLATPGSIRRCGGAFMFLADELTHSRNLDFETKGLPPEHAGSWSRKYPELYADLLEIFKVVPSHSQFFISGIPMGMLAGEVLETVRMGKEGLRQEIQEVLANYREQQQGVMVPQQMHGLDHVIHVLEHSLEGLVTTPESESNWRGRISWSRYVSLLESVSHIPFYAQPDIVHAVTTEGIRVGSYWGELRAAFVLPNIHRVGVTVESFADHFPELRYRLRQLPDKLRHSDIDIVSVIAPRTRSYPGHWAWTEVKTLRGPFDLSPWNHDTMEKLRESLRTQMRAAHILGIDVEFQVAFINGLQASAKQALYKLGYSRVFGEVFP